MRFCARAEEEEEGSGCFWKTVERSGNVFGLSLRQILERAEILRLLSFHTRYVYMSVGCWAMDHGLVQARRLLLSFKYLLRHGHCSYVE
mgnify:CR=1 FL=1